MFETTVLDYDSILHVAENLREPDRHEINAGRGADGDRADDDWEELAEHCMRHARFGFVAKKDDEPVAVICAARVRCRSSRMRPMLDPKLLNRPTTTVGSRHSAPRT